MKQYFTIKELCHSDTADTYHIINIPDEDDLKNLNRLIDFLNPLREC